MADNRISEPAVMTFKINCKEISTCGGLFFQGHDIFLLENISMMKILEEIKIGLRILCQQTICDGLTHVLTLVT